MDASAVSEARRLRVEEQLSAGQIRQRLGLSKDQLYAALRGVPPPAWTRRPNAKDELRARAVELRRGGHARVGDGDWRSARDWMTRYADHAAQSAVV